MSLAKASRSMNSAIDEMRLASAFAMPRVFISYARPDRERVEALTTRLKSQGYIVWWDDEIVPGEFFDERISEAIDAAHAVVVLWSKHSYKSRWVRWEATQGLRSGKLIPVLANGLDLRDIRPPFNDLDTLDATDEAGLLGALNRIKSRER